MWDILRAYVGHFTRLCGTFYALMWDIFILRHTKSVILLVYNYKRGAFYGKRACQI